MLFDVFIIFAGACWGSFLNVLAVRGLAGLSLFDRSRCVSCIRELRWWELIPVVSWVILRGRCATCRERISLWYPIIEGVTALWIWSLVYMVPLHFFPAFFLLSSALIVTMRTDGEHLLIMSWCTIGIIPFGLVAAYTGFLPITFIESVLGCALGAAYLMSMRALFLWWKQYEGLGEGDIELIAAIGSFLGPLGMITTLAIAASLATAYGLLRLVASPRTTLQTPIPFGLFLALGSWGTMVIKGF